MGNTEEAAKKTRKGVKKRGKHHGVLLMQVLLKWIIQRKLTSAPYLKRTDPNEVFSTSVLLRLAINEHSIKVLFKL